MDAGSGRLRVNAAGVRTMGWGRCEVRAVASDGPTLREGLSVGCDISGAVVHRAGGSTGT